MQTNPELELAYRFVTETDRHLFLTGKAGTGKTTFLHRVRREVDKRMVVVAPTGVAAINARGVTIHSQFQLPFGVLTPDRLRADLRRQRLSRKKADVLRHLDLLVIDEISMVRADVLDAISAVLSKVRRDDRPFGGVQLLMIGDLHQLPPVVREEDQALLRPHYTTSYFFGSRRLQEAEMRTVQLTHIYRQADPTFIRLLNQVRTDQLTGKDLAALNSRYRDADYIAAQADDHITLTSHNRQARRLNEGKLAALSTPLSVFEAEIKGKFPESMYPNDPKLSFRVGARVMFNKNDTADRLYYNGKIGTITAIEGEEIKVECPGGEEVVVLPVEWENRRFEVNAVTQEVDDDVIGRYIQHPLRLAWAITIHKSQGLTFDRVIIDAANAFAHGQVYVALSRCKTFNGIILQSRIGETSVHTDRVVSKHSEQAEASPPTPADLFEDRRRYQLNCLREVFTFGPLVEVLNQLARISLEREASIQGSIHADTLALRERVERELLRTAHRFRSELAEYAQHAALPVDHPELLDRLKKAAGHFLPLLAEVTKEAAGLTYHSDNQQVARALNEQLERLDQFLREKRLGFVVLKAGFTPAAYVKARAQATQLQSQSGSTTTKNRTRPKMTVTIGDQQLYDRLVDWRNERAAREEKPAYCILPNRVLIGIAESLPENQLELLALHGFGRKSWERYGEELLAMVSSRSPHSVDSPIPVPAKDRRPSRVISYEAFLSGKSVETIASERSLTVGTIYTHLSYFVRTGQLEVKTLLPDEALDAIVPYLNADREVPDSHIYRLLGEEYAYHQIRLARAHLEAEKVGADAGAVQLVV
jgi:hypothetical protein